MIKKIAALIVIPLLTACAANEPHPGPVSTVVESKPIYNPPLPSRVNMLDIRWRVLTSKDFAELAKDQNSTVVFVALTPQGYENLSLNNQELKRYILEQQNIIMYYRSLNSEKVDTSKNNNDNKSPTQ